MQNLRPAGSKAQWKPKKSLQIWLFFTSIYGKIWRFLKNFDHLAAEAVIILAPHLENHSSFYRGEQSHAFFKLLFLQIIPCKQSFRLRNQRFSLTFNVSERFFNILHNFFSTFVRKTTAKKS